MIYSLKGAVTHVAESFLVVEVAGVGFKVAVPARTLGKAVVGSEVALFSHLHVREDALDLYGFLSEQELKFFELLIGVSGVGPRSALAILDVADLRDIAAAIKEGRPELLSRASGIGRKTAERVIVELKSKVEVAESDAVVRRMESDSDLVETLTNLGYRREEARAAIEKISKDTHGLEPRLKEALKLLGSRTR